jgi:transcriptional regulator with XRE-family HTH domain
LAATSGVSAGAISNYENDVSTPPAPTLRKIVVALAQAGGVDVARLWEELGVVMDRHNENQARLELVKSAGA